MTNLTAPQFINADAAREHLEALRWPQGPVCARCGSLDAKRLPDQRGKASKRHPEGSVRKGVVQCNGCRQQFTVTVGTVFEDSKVPLNKWLLAVHLLCASKKGMSAHQLHRMLDVTYKTAWFMAHRIREAMVPTDTRPMGGEGGFVEADETFIGRVPGESRMAIHNMNKIVSLIDRATGRATSTVITGFISSGNVGKVLLDNVSRNATLMTDEGRHYTNMGKLFAAHHTVNHRAGEYVRRGAPEYTTNTIEGFFGIFKRGMKGVYQHCGSQHLQRYLREFDFRYSNRAALGVNDDMRAEIALLGIAGKRLTYRRTGGLAA